MNIEFIYLNLLDAYAARSTKGPTIISIHKPTTNLYNSFLELPHLWMGLLRVHGRHYTAWIHYNKPNQIHAAASGRDLMK